MSKAKILSAEVNLRQLKEANSQMKFKLDAIPEQLETAKLEYEAKVEQLEEKKSIFANGIIENENVIAQLEEKIATAKSEVEKAK